MTNIFAAKIIFSEEAAFHLWGLLTGIMLEFG
jgi:hypothetical protein